jgi:hypothetical protein
MQQLLPTLRLVLMVRDPVDRAFSEYNMKASVRSRVCTLPFCSFVQPTQVRRVTRQLNVSDAGTQAAAQRTLHNCYFPLPTLGDHCGSCSRDRRARACMRKRLRGA